MNEGLEDATEMPFSSSEQSSTSRYPRRTSPNSNNLTTRVEEYNFFEDGDLENEFELTEHPISTNGQQVAASSQSVPIQQQSRERVERERETNYSTKSNLVQQFNSKNAKICAFFIICGFVLYHTILRLTHGLDSCNWLLSDGNFRDQVWQPYGCMMHHYSHTDSKRCLRYIQYWEGKNHFVFMGDARVEQLYHAFIHQILPMYKGIRVVPDRTGNKISDPTSSSSDKKIYDGSGSKNQEIFEDEFLFPPSKLLNLDQSYNDSQLGLHVQFLSHPFPNNSMINALRQWKAGTEIPRVLVIGTGSWWIRDRDTDIDPFAIEEYTASLSRVVMQLDRLADSGSKVLWTLQEPINSEIITQDWASLTNEKIELYNSESLKVLRHSKADIWSSARLVAKENIDETIDGYHLGAKTLFQDTQILLNMYCNDNMNYNDATCCSSSENISKLQIVTFSFLGVGFVLSCFAFIKDKWWNTRNHKGFNYNRLYGIDKEKNLKNEQIPLSSKPTMAFAKLALLMVFFFICDRTTMFMKENKFFTQTNFWLPVVYILVLGIFFTEDSNWTKILHYDQDNETKGWMILLILVYNVMGASQVLPIYMFVKILYTAFLFLHGWNQLLNYLYRGDYSFVRCCQDLFRLNMMAVMLCLCMNLPYQFYEFVPLISFWTLIVHIALSVPPRVTFADCELNSLTYLYLVLKIVGLISFVTILYMSEVFFEKVFVTRPWKALFVSTDDDIHDWWTRWKIDRYSMPCGMICALITHVARRYQIVHDDNHGNLFSTRISLSAILFSLLGIGGYCVFSVYCRNQQECLEIHSYVGFIPVASYIILRNVSGILRTRFSTFFSWFGQFWVELLVGQFHVWMAADGSGVLVLVPAYPVGNVLLTAFVFACTAHEIHECTDALVSVAVPEDWRKALRNLFIFLLILIPIGISDGMF